MKEAININVQVSTCRYIEHLHLRSGGYMNRYTVLYRYMKQLQCKRKNKENKNLLNNNPGRGKIKGLKRKGKMIIMCDRAKLLVSTVNYGYICLR